MGYTPLDLDKINSNNDRLITVFLIILDAIAVILAILLFLLIKQKIVNN